MREMKFIQIYEKFDSSKLGKTLSFVDKKYKKIFINEIKNVCKSLDFPISLLSDDMFEYLPFKAALNVKSSLDLKEEKCSKCGGVGKIDKNWGNKYGKGVTPTDCVSCLGKGSVLKKDGQLEYIKFWFNSEGKYIGSTIVDGIIRKKSVLSDSSINGTEYETDRVISLTELRKLPTGTVFSVRLGTNRTPSTCILYNMNNRHGEVYAIQNTQPGSAPPNDEWRKYGPRSWSLQSSGEYNGSITLLKRKDSTKDPKDNRENPYEWNAVMYYSPSTNKISNIMDDVELYLKEANFALILDYKKLNIKEFTTVTKTKEQRVDSKKNALSLMKNDEIKRANIERYFTKLAEQLNVEKDFQGSISMVSRIFGGQFSLIHIYGQWKFEDFSYLISEIESVVSNNLGSSDKKYYLEKISTRLKSMYKFSIERNSSLSKNLKEVKKLASGKEKEKEVIYILDKIIEIGKKINSKIMDSSCESLFDLEVLNYKINSISSFSRGSRFTIHDLRYVMEYLRNYPVDCYQSIINATDSRTYSKITKNLDYLLKYIEKL